MLKNIVDVFSSATGPDRIFVQKKYIYKPCLETLTVEEQSMVIKTK